MKLWDKIKNKLWRRKDMSCCGGHRSNNCIGVGDKVRTTRDYGRTVLGSRKQYGGLCCCHASEEIKGRVTRRCNSHGNELIYFNCQCCGTEHFMNVYWVELDTCHCNCHCHCHCNCHHNCCSCHCNCSCDCRQEEIEKLKRNAMYR